MRVGQTEIDCGRVTLDLFGRIAACHGGNLNDCTGAAEIVQLFQVNRRAHAIHDPVTDGGHTRNFTLDREQSAAQDDLRKELEQDGITVRAGSMAGLAEEAPIAYKDVDAVVETVHGAGIARKVARLLPLGVIKG